MSTQTLMKSARWVLTGDGEQGVFDARCATCNEASGPAADDVRPVRTWAMHHTNTHPEHRHYVLNTTRQRWYVDARADPPAPAPASATECQPAQRPTHRARARARGVRRVRGRVGPYAGPLFIAMVSGALGFVLYAALIEVATGHG